MTIPFPNFDPKVFSDNELFDKQLDLIKRRYMALRFGKTDMANQIDLFIQAIEMERKERMFNERIMPMMVGGDPVVVETEPNLQIKPDEEQPASTATTPATTTRRRYVRTSQPITP